MNFLLKAAFSVLGRNLTPASPRLVSAYGGGPTSSGERVSVNTALQLETVWACVRLIAGTVSTLPAQFYSRDAQGRGTVAYAHPLYSLLHDQPNYDMTATVFWETTVACMLLWGNAYVRITRAGGRVIAMTPLLPSQVNRVRREDGSLVFVVSGPAGPEPVDEAEIAHFKGFSLDGELGLSPVSQARETLGLAMAAEKAAGSLFRNGMRPSFLLTIARTLDKAQRDRFDTDFLPQFTGSVNAGKVALLEGGMDLKSVGMNPADAQLLATRSFSIEQICRWFGVQPVMIGHMDKGTSWGCLPGDSLVFTEHGPVPIEQIEPGVKVWSFDGKTMVLSSVKARMMTGHKPVREIRTASRTLRLTDNHVVFVRRYFGRAAGMQMGDCAWKNLWIRADEVKKGDWVAIPHGLPCESTISTTPDGITLTVGMMEMAGLYTGDGSRDKNRIEFAHEHGADYIGHYADAAREAFGAEPYLDGQTGTRTRFSSAQAIAFLAPFMGTSLTKRVPPWVFGLRRDLIAAFLRGYVDSDGCICRGRIEYTSCNKALLEDVRHLAMLIGVPTGRVRMSRKAGFGFIRGRRHVQGEKYNLSFSSVSHNQIIGSNSPTKASNLRTGQTERTLSYDAEWDRDWRLEGRHNSQSPGFGFNVDGLRLQKVRQITEPSAELIPVYDIEVSDTASFIADGVLVHNSGLEQMNLWFLTYTLRSILRTIEQEVRRSLLTPVERANFYLEFNVEGLLRADSVGRSALLKVYAENGLRTRNELRALDNMPPLPGGDDLTVMSNMLPAQLLGQVARLPLEKPVDAGFTATPPKPQENQGTENA